MDEVRLAVDVVRLMMMLTRLLLKLGRTKVHQGRLDLGMWLVVRWLELAPWAGNACVGRILLLLVSTLLVVR